MLANYIFFENPVAKEKNMLLQWDTKYMLFGGFYLRQLTQMYKQTFIWDPESFRNCSIGFPLFTSEGIILSSCCLWTTKEITSGHTSKLSCTAIKSIDLDLENYFLWKGFIPIAVRTSVFRFFFFFLLKHREHIGDYYKYLFYFTNLFIGLQRGLVKQRLSWT